MVVADASLYSAGNYAEIMQTNGAWDTQPVSWADNSIGQIMHITSVNGDTLFFDEALRINYDYSLNPRIHRVDPRIEVGIECLKIERVDDSPVGVNFNVNLSYAANCWITGVEIGTSIAVSYTHLTLPTSDLV